MKQSIFNFKQSFSILSIFALLLFVNPLATAQTEEIRESTSTSITTTQDGKVKLKVEIKKGNDTTTFEKTYDSKEDMHNDPDLEKYGINLGGFGFNSGSFGFQAKSPQFYFHSGPSGSFWDDEDFESMKERMEEMMKGFGSGGFFFDDDNFTAFDSLVNQFHFKSDDGKVFLNGKEIMDMDSLQNALKDQFGNMRFDFDFDNDFDWEEEDEQDIRVIRRARVYVRSARDEDRKIAETDELESLQLNNISFFPNPSDGRFTIELDTPNDEPIQLIIVDKNGSEVFNLSLSPRNGFVEKGIDLSAEGKGIYILKVLQNGRALTKRIVVE